MSGFVILRSRGRRLMPLHWRNLFNATQAADDGAGDGPAASAVPSDCWPMAGDGKPLGHDGTDTMPRSVPSPGKSAGFTATATPGAA